MSFPQSLASFDALVPFAALVAIKVTILFAAAAALVFALRRQSAALRHLVWSLAIGGSVMLPAASLGPFKLPLLPAREASFPAPDREHAVPSASDATIPLTPSAAPDEPAAIETAAPEGVPFDAGRILLIAWLVGAIALLARFAVGARSVLGVAGRAVPLADEEWIAIARRARGSSVSGAFDLRVSDEIEMPFVSGLATPAVVLPASSLEWTMERREAVLLHELAHLSRGDLLMNALSHVARAFFWFNPLAWYASHRLRIEGERACDDAVLRRGARASDYADHLLSIASGGGPGLPTAALAMARPSAFEGRLLAILEPGVQRGAPSRRRVAAMVAAFVVLILPLAAASPTARVAAMPFAQDAGSESTAQGAARASSAVPALIEALSDASAAVRLAAINSLGQLEDPRAIAALGKALREDTDARVRQAAAHALGEIDDPRGVPHLLDALKTERVADVREQIVQSLGEIDDPSALAGIAAVANDASVPVRRAVASALGELEDRAAVPTLVGMARDQDTEIRRTVADALGNLEDPSAFDALVALTRDGDAEVRSSAVNALGNLEDARTLGTLVAALKDANAEVRSHAADAIHNIPDLETAPKALIDALSDSDREVRANVAHALGDIGDEAAVPALRKALGDTNAEVRRAVAEALSDIGGAEAITALMGLLKDQDADIRRIAAEALGKRR